MAGKSIVSEVTTIVSADVEGLRTQLRVAEGFVEKLQSKIATSGTAAAGSAKQYGVAATRIASVGEAAARAGELGAQGAKQLISSASNIAFAFGPQGALIGAVSIATLAIVQLFTRTSEEAKRAKANLDELREARVQRTERENPTLDPLQKLIDANARLLEVRTKLRNLEIASSEKRKQEARDEETQILADRDFALKALAEAKEARGDARVKATDDEAKALGALLAAGKASNAERERAAQLVRETKEDLAVLATFGKADAATIAERASLTERLKSLTEGVEAAQKKAADAAKKTTEEHERQVKAAQQLSDTLATELANISATQVDDLERALEIAIRSRREELAALKEISAEERALRTAQIDRAQVAGRANIEAVRAVEQATAAMARTLTPGRESSTEQATELVGILRTLQAEQKKFTEGSAAYALIAKQIRDIEEERVKINKDIADELKDQVNAIADAVTENVKRFVQGEKDRADAAERAFRIELQRAQAIQDAVIGTQQLLSALSGGADEAERMLGSILQIATQIPIAAAQLKQFKAGTKDAQGNALSTLSDVVGSVLPIIGGIASLVSLLGQDSAAAARHRENLQALRAIEKNTGDLVGRDVSGTEIGVARRAADVVLEQGRRGPFPVEEFILDIGQVLERAGISLDEVKAIAERFNITLDGSAASWEALRKAIFDLDFAAFTATFEGQMSRIEAELRLEGITDPLEIFLRKIDVLRKNSEAINEALGDIDLTTVAGRGQAQAALEDRLRRALGGELTAEDLGGLSLDQFIEETLRAIEQLRDLVPTAAEAFAEATSKLALEAEIFGRSLAEQAEGLLGAAQDAFAGVFDDLDLGDPEAIRGALKDFFTQANADSEIDAAEQAIIDAFLAIIGAIEAGANEAAQAANAARDKIFSDARRDIELRDVEDPAEQFRSIAGALEQAFPALAGLMEKFDLSTIDGIKAFGDAIPDLIAGLESGSLVIDGLAVEDIPALIAALVGIESAGDAAERALDQLADKISRTFGEIDLDAAIFGTSDVDALNKKFETIGLSAFDLGSQAGRDAALAALRALATEDSSLKPLIADLIRSLGGLPDLPGAIKDAVGDGLSGGSETSSISRDAQALSQVTGNRMADYLRTLVDLVRDIRNTVTTSTLGALTFPAPPPPTVAPSIETLIPRTITTTVTGGLTFHIPSINVVVNAGATSDADTLSRLLSTAIVRDLATEVSKVIAADTLQARRFAGDGRLTS